MSPTLEICRIARHLRYEKLPPTVVNISKQLIRDGMGVMLAGMKHPTVNILAQHVRALGCHGDSPVYGYPFRTSPQEAAFINGTAGHVLDYEPMFLPPTHVVSPILPALLALAHTRSDPNRGKRFVTAFAAGVQLQASLRAAALPSDHQANQQRRHFPFQKQGFHPPGIVGALGSALASGIWLGLKRKQLAAALGIAASRACGLAGNIGTMVKATHCGHAARIGVESALLAQRGFTASTNILDTPSGWGSVFGGEGFDCGRIINDMRSLPSFNRPGFAFKKWPAHTAMQVAIAAAIPLHNKGHVPKEVHIHAPVFKYCDRPFPKDSDEARFSFQYNVALGILDGKVDLSSHSKERLALKDMRALLSATTLHLDSGITASFNGMEVRIRLDDGRESKSDRWPGHWTSPCSDGDLKKKFIACTSELYPTDTAENLAGILWNIEYPDQFDLILQLLDKEQVALHS